MTDREAMKLALDFLESGMPSDPYGMDKEQHQTAITALRQTLEQPEQEFVSWGYRDKRGKIRLLEPYEARMDMFPLYTAPPKREWVGLADEEIFDVIRSLCADNETAEMLIHVSMDEYRAIEAKLKEKNK